MASGDMAGFIIAKSREVPSHVPPDLVRTFDFRAAPGLASCPHATLAKLRDEPRLFYNFVGMDVQGRAGYWVPTRAEDVRDILQQPEDFSAKGIARFSALMGESWDLIPAEVDPPGHTAYRQFLNPMFGPGAVRPLEDRIRSQAVKLIDALVPLGGCEFMNDFAKPFPILIVMTMLGLPMERYDEVVAWGHDLHEGTSMEQRARGAVAIGHFLREEIARAQASAPRDDVISRIAHGEVQGRPLTEDETIGMVYLLFTGGIHTVTASLGFHFDYLARHADVQQSLREDPARIPAAIDEFLRMFGVVNSFRIATRDREFAGVEIKAGEWVMIPLPLVNYDPQAFPAPDEVDIARRPNRQMSFSSGHHFCLGSHLARSELSIAYEEWLRRAPPFRTAAGPTHFLGGALLGVEAVELTWS